jgi:hypothetical protein
MHEFGGVGCVLGGARLTEYRCVRLDGERGAGDRSKRAQAAPLAAEQRGAP